MLAERKGKQATLVPEPAMTRPSIARLRSYRTIGGGFIPMAALEIPKELHFCPHAAYR